MVDRQLEFFIYDHEERTFNYFEGDKSRLEAIMAAENPEEMGHELDEEEIDGLLVMDEGGGRWFLTFGESLGIVGQRTARRQADTIARSGYRLPDGYWLKGDYPLEELSDANIGDLWKSVQTKYVKSDLKGMEVDEETGLPSQLAQRAKDLKSQGVQDELADPKFEKEEAEARRKAEAKTKQSQSKSKKKAKKSKKTTKTTKKSEKEPDKEEEVEKKEEPKEVKETKKKTKKKSKKKSKKTESKSKKKTKKEEEVDQPMFLEIEKIRNFVLEGATKIVARGTLTEGTEKPVPATVIFEQNSLDPKDWAEIAIFLDEGDVVQISTDETDQGLVATSVKV